MQEKPSPRTISVDRSARSQAHGLICRQHSAGFFEGGRAHAPLRQRQRHSRCWLSSVIVLPLLTRVLRAGAAYSSPRCLSMPTLGQCSRRSDHRQNRVEYLRGACALVSLDSHRSCQFRGLSAQSTV